MASGKAMRLCIQTLFFDLVVDIDVITSLQNNQELEELKEVEEE